MGILTYVQLAKTEDVSILTAESNRLKKLRLQSLQNDPKSFLSTYAHEVNQPQEFWLNRYRDPAAQHWVAVNTDELDTDWVAFLVVVVQPCQYETGTHQTQETIRNLTIGQYLAAAVYVDPAWRRRDICTNLMLLVKQWVAKDTYEKGFSRSYLNLNVREDNEAARKLYAKLGFAELGQETMTTETEPDKQRTVVNMRMEVLLDDAI